MFDTILAHLLEDFEVEPVRSGHGYRVVYLRSRDDTGIFEGLPRGTILADVNVQHSRPADISFDELAVTIRELGLPVERLQAIKRYVFPRINAASEAGRAGAPAREADASTPSTTTATPTTPARNVGHSWRIADQYYGDTALIASMQAAGFPAEHAGLGYFDVVLPKGKISFNRARDERLFEDQSGRLHTLDPQGDVDLPAVLAELEAAGHAASGGEWETMPTSYPPPKEPILASVPPPPEPAPGAEAEEPEADAPAPTVTAEEGGLEFSIDPKELQGALNLIKRIADLKLERLSLVQIECHGHVFFRIGVPRRFFELRLQSTRCAAMGDATVSVKSLLDAARTLGKQRLTIRKVAHEPVLRLVSSGRQVEIATTDYTPSGLASDPIHVLTLPSDVLADLFHRTTFAIGRDEAHKSFMVLHLESDGERLTFSSMDGTRLALARIPAVGASRLDGFQINRPAAERVEALMEQHLALGGRRGRGASRTAPPVQILVAPETISRPKMLVFRSELFTFAAAYVDIVFPSFRQTIPAVDTLGGLAVVAAREVEDALAAIARTKGEAVFEFKDGLQITNAASGGQPLLRFAVRDAFASGPPRRIKLNPELIRPAIAAASGDDRAHVGLAYQGDDPRGPLVVTRWLANERPRDRREALAKLHEEVQTQNLASIMPMA